MEGRARKKSAPRPVRITQRIHGRGDVGQEHLACISEAERYVRGAIGLGLSPQEIVEGLGDDLMSRYGPLWRRIDAWTNGTMIEIIYR